MDAHLGGWPVSVICRVLKVTPVNTLAARRRLADDTVSRGGYPFA